MAKFENVDLANITILNCREIEENGEHQHFRIRVKDENDNHYMWKDTDIVCGCDEPTLIAAIKAHVLTLDKIEPVVLPVILKNDRDDVIGNTLS